MLRLTKFLSLGPSDRYLLLRAAFLLSVIRAGLRLFSFQRMRRALAGMARAAPSPVAYCASAAKIVWAVTVASRCAPRASCLTRALTTQVLLRQGGHPAELRIGVARSDGGRLEAHAWVESGGTIVVGDNGDLARYAQLPPLNLEGSGL